MSWPRSQRLAVVLASIVIAAALFFHFAMTALYNTPFNPVKKDFDDVIGTYMNPHFAQDWHLFAPNPIDVDSGILVRSKIQAEHGLQVTQWVDITTPHITKIHRQRAWPARVDRLPTGVKAQVESWSDPILQELREKNADKLRGESNKKTVEDPPLTAGEKEAYENAIRYAQALATAEARRRWGSRVQDVQVRIVSNEFPRFSQRHVREAKGKVSYYDLAWMKAVKVSNDD
jgi:hypothetical protein